LAVSGPPEFERRFSTPLWLLAVALGVLFTARGMQIPFLVIFFGQVRGFGEGVAGTGLAINAISGVVFTLMVAGVIDRFGARPVLIMTIAGIGVATMAFPFVTTIPMFFLAMAVQGCATQLFWPAADSLSTSLIDIRNAGRMFALIRITQAIGIGTGGLASGLIVAGGGLAQYQLMFIVSAIGCIVAATLVLVLVRTTRNAPERPGAPTARIEPTGWLVVLRDRRFMFSQAILFMLVAGFVQLQVSVPPFLRAEAGMRESLIGAMFAVKTVLLVIFQMPVAGRISGWGRGVTISLAALAWMTAYALIGFSPWLLFLPFVAVVAFVIGEMLFMPTSGVIVVELAPERLRGRYLALSSIFWGTAWGVSSMLAGMILGSSAPYMVWPAIIMVLMIGAICGWIFDRTAPESRKQEEPTPGTVELAR
jgi:MFS family permease